MVNKRRVKPLSWIIALCSSPRFSYFPTHWPHSTKKCHPKTKICLRVTFYWFLVIDYLLAFSIHSQLRSSLLQRETGLFKIVQTDKTHLEKNGSHGSMVFEWFVQRLFYRSKHPTVYLLSSKAIWHLVYSTYWNKFQVVLEERKHSLRSNSIEKLCCISHIARAWLKA